MPQVRAIAVAARREYRANRKRNQIGRRPSTRSSRRTCIALKLPLTHAACSSRQTHCREFVQLRQQLLAAEEDNQSLGAKLANAEQEMARLGAAPKRAEERVRELEAARQEQAGLIDRLQKSVTTLESTVRQQAQGSFSPSVVAIATGFSAHVYFCFVACSGDANCARCHSGKLDVHPIDSNEVVL